MNTRWTDKAPASSPHVRTEVALHDLPSTPKIQAAMRSMQAQGMEKITITAENIDRYMPLLEAAYHDGYMQIFTNPDEREPFERWVSDIRAGAEIPNMRVITLFGKHLQSDAPELISVGASELYRLEDGSMCMFPNYYYSMERAQRDEQPNKDARAEINPPIPVMFAAQLGDATQMAEAEGKRISSLFFEAEDPNKTAEAGYEGQEQRQVMARNRMYESMMKHFDIPHLKIPHYVQQPLEEGAAPCEVLTGRFVGTATQARSFIDQFQKAFTDKGLDENAAAEPQTYGPMRDGLDQMIAAGTHTKPASLNVDAIALGGTLKGRAH